MYDLSKIEFKGEKRFLSNMYETKIKFVFTEEQKEMFPNITPDYLTYPSTEHIYQLMKSENPKWIEMIRNTLDPLKTKVYSRKYLKKDILFETEKNYLFKSDFDKYKYELMHSIVLLKFEQNEELRKKLLSIEGKIEERNCWGDKYWGTVDGIGENNLGKILMEVRDYLKEKNEIK